MALREYKHCWSAW